MDAQINSHEVTHWIYEEPKQTEWTIDNYIYGWEIYGVDFELFGDAMMKDFRTDTKDSFFIRKNIVDMTSSYQVNANGDRSKYDEWVVLGILQDYLLNGFIESGVYMEHTHILWIKEIWNIAQRLLSAKITPFKDELLYKTHSWTSHV